MMSWGEGGWLQLIFDFFVAVRVWFDGVEAFVFFFFGLEALGLGVIAFVAVVTIAVGIVVLDLVHDHAAFVFVDQFAWERHFVAIVWVHVGFLDDDFDVLMMVTKAPYGRLVAVA